MTNNEIIGLVIGSAALGYMSFLAVLFILPRRLKAENVSQRKKIIQEAEQQALRLTQDSLARVNGQIEDAKEELESEVHDRGQDLENAARNLDEQESSIQREQSRVDKRSNEINNVEKRLDSVRSEADSVIVQINDQQKHLIEKLGEVTQIEPNRYAASRADELVNERQLEAQRLIKQLEEELGSTVKKTATRVLLRAQARYAPNFAWPKAVNHVDLKNPSLIEALSDEKCQLVADLRELADQVQIEVVTTQNHEVPAILKLGGGFGLHREAARLTLEEILPQKQTWHKVAQTFEKHRQALDNQALKLGHQAVHELKLQNVHPELARMVGHLNWRTSYRQNQYLHTLEVARFAGMLAFELGEDPDFAKRSGLIHDIGKSIDYRIDGSHAVISGDYADRFGEHRTVCDTAMSHHNDLVLETPLSFILKTADTLSGARPGARVNLEEGYNIRLSAIDDAVRSFKGVQKIEIMNGGREVHVQVSPDRVAEDDLSKLSADIARSIEEQVAYPGTIKVMVSRRFEVVSVA